MVQQGGVRARRLAYGVLLVVTAVAWLHVLRGAAADDMAGMDMPMAPGVAEGLAYVLGWGIMMTAMMLPSALPMIGLYAAMQQPAARTAALPVTVFTLVYLLVWTATGVPMYLASAASSAVPAAWRAYAIGAVLILTGIFQLTPLKLACLRRCRSPIGFLLGRWRAGWRGGLALGWSHALYCLGCCWALMVVLVAAGSMGLAWVLLIAAAVAAEKVLPWGEWIARATGVALVILGLAVIGRPELTAAMRAGGHSM